jgi:hypothetical protein
LGADDYEKTRQLLNQAVNARGQDLPALVREQAGFINLERRPRAPESGAGARPGPQLSSGGRITIIGNGGM